MEAKYEVALRDIKQEFLEKAPEEIHREKNQE